MSSNENNGGSPIPGCHRLALPGRAFLSGDYHLLPGEPAEALARFLELLERGDAAIFLGDLFEVWYENRGGHVSGYEPMLALLENAKKRGVDLHLVAGNRDFLAGDQLRRAAGMTVHPCPLLLEGRRPLLVVHGDELLPDDRSYQRYKAIARNPFMLFLLRNAPLFMLDRLARGARQASRAKIAKLPAQHFTPTLEPLLPLLKGCGAELAVAGHLHQDIELISADGRHTCRVLPDSRPDCVRYRVFDGASLSELRACRTTT